MLNQHFIKSSFIPHTDIYMDASISRIVTHLLVYNHGKFHAFIKNCTIVALNSPTRRMQLKLKVCAIVKQIDIMLLLSSAILT